MNSEEQRITIAEACDYTMIQKTVSLRKITRWYGRHKDKPGWLELPNYPVCLNAIHEAEKMILKTDEHWRQYCCWIAKIIVGDLQPKNSGNHYHVPNRVLISAPASIRTEALIQIIKK